MKFTAKSQKNVIGCENRSNEITAPEKVSHMMNKTITRRMLLALLCVTLINGVMFKLNAQYTIDGSEDLLALKVTTQEWSANLAVITDDKKVKISDELNYHWFKAQEIHTTVGGYSGRLLHNEFEKFDRDGNLVEQGQFEKGLKTGTWKTWYVSGAIETQSDWKKGRLHGIVRKYNDAGALVLYAEYKNGMLHGTYTEYDNGGVVLEQTYKNGVLKLPKEKKINEPRQQDNNTEE